MRTSWQIVALSAALSMASFAYGQKAMIKGGIVPIPDLGNSIIVLDIGFEYKINHRLSSQFSWSHSSHTGEGDIKKPFIKTVYSLQGRYYFKGENWSRSPFAGVLIQKYAKQDWIVRDRGLHGYVSHQKVANKGALGIICGRNVHILEFIGMDFHAGVVGQLGNEFISTQSSINAPRVDLLHRNALDFRFFWGVNGCIILGKMPPKRAKPNGN